MSARACENGSCSLDLQTYLLLLICLIWPSSFPINFLKPHTLLIVSIVVYGKQILFCSLHLKGLNLHIKRQSMQGNYAIICKKTVVLRAAV